LGTLRPIGDARHCRGLAVASVGEECQSRLPIVFRDEREEVVANQPITWVPMQPAGYRIGVDDSMIAVQDDDPIRRCSYHGCQQVEPERLRGRCRRAGGGAVLVPTCNLPHEPCQRVAGAYPAQCANPLPIALHPSCRRKAAATSKRVTSRWCVWWVSWSKVALTSDHRVGYLHEPRAERRCMRVRNDRRARLREQRRECSTARTREELSNRRLQI